MDACILVDSSKLRMIFYPRVTIISYETVNILFQEYLKSRACNVKTDWVINLPELLMDAGAYQYHMDPTLTIDKQYKDIKYTMKPAALASDIIVFPNRPVPVSPALCMAPDLDGTNTPSYESFDKISVSKVTGF